MGSMLCPVLISRDTELRQLTAALDDAQNRQGCIVFLTGDPGVGKTRLANELSAIAESRGFHVVSGRAVESASPLPFRPVTEALMKIARSDGIPFSPEISDYRPALATLVPAWGQCAPDGEAEISPLIIGEALIRLLSLYGSPGALLVLEDIQWADPETLAIVQYLADNLAGKPLLCVATLRDSEPSAGLDAVMSIHARRAAPMIVVPRLTDEEVEQLAACCLDAEVPPTVTKRLLVGCDGLPFAVEEILAAAAASGEIAKGPAGWQVNENITTGVPASILGSVRHRLASLGPQVTNLIVSAAVLGRQFDWTLLPRLAGMTESAALLALDQAHAVQLIEPCPGTNMFRFRHSLTRDAIVSDLLPPDLASRSDAAATAIENAHPGLPGMWCEQAAELHKAAGHPVRAANLLLEAGRRALHQGALDSAAETLQGARGVLATVAADESMLAIAIDEALAETLEAAGDRERLAPLAESLVEALELAGADPRRQALIRIRAARVEAESNPVAAAAHLAAARSIADKLDDIALACQVDTAAAGGALLSGDLDLAEQLANQSLAAAEQAGRSGWAADVAFEALQVLGRRERMRDLLAARAAFMGAYRLASGPDFAVRRIKALQELGNVDMLQDGGTSRLIEATKLAHQAGAISTAMLAELQLANVWSLKADLDQAMTSALACEQSARRINARKLEALSLSVQALICGIRSDRDGTEAAAERAEEIAPGEQEVLFTTWGQARVTASLFWDDIDRALEESIAGRAYAGRAALTAPRRAWGYYAVLQAVYGLDGRGAIQQARDSGAAIGWIQGLLAYAEAVLEGREGHRARATALAAEGAALLAPFAPWWNHLVRRLVATSALQDGWGQPVAWLREATVELEATSHARLASACRGILRRAGERVPRSGRGQAQVPPQMRRLGITSREMDVYLLVAQGLSNAEIAARLFISPKTVETHVASLVNKTGQAGRRELVAHAARAAGSA
ncbi:MAG TPA: AAA family ATPase [Streptosporangiaceae bacterium]|nr:AAA family ATPase [Streptosporangiaceae bacterium]